MELLQGDAHSIGGMLKAWWKLEDG